MQSPASTPTYFHPTPRQLAALAVYVAQNLAWDAPNDSSATAYGHAVAARQGLEDGMGDIERAEFWTLLQTLTELRYAARAVVGEAS